MRTPQTTLNATRATYYISFENSAPLRFILRDEKGNIYYTRDLRGRFDKIKFNVCHTRELFANVPFVVEKVEPLQTNGESIKLPAPERTEWKDFRIVRNPDLKGTPARIFAKTGLIEIGEDFEKYPSPVRLFILLHEVGHMFYKTEWKTDLFALKIYLMLGFNESNAFYALSKVLSHSRENVDRVKRLFHSINNKK